MNEKSIMELLETEEFVIYPVKGISMLPLLDEDHDLVKLVKLTGEPQKYDVALFERENGSLVLHRIIEVGKKYCVFCGDNQTTPERVKRSRIFAKAVGFFKEEKFIPADDKDYLKYVEDICRDIPSRKPIRKIPRAWTDLILLICAATRGEKAKIVEYGKAFALARRHCVASLAFRAVDKDDCPPEIYEKWSGIADRELSRDIVFDAEREAIFAELDKENIKHIALKGIVIKSLYPERGMREYADNDVLCEPSSADRINEIMTSRGYEATLGPVHDSYHKKPFFNFEMHKALFLKNSPYYPAFEHVWERVEKVGDGAEYKMAVADFYLYFVAHFAKHFSGYGTGVRYFCDIYLIKRKMLAQADANEISALLEKAGLAEFEKKASDLSEKMFLAPETLTFDDLNYIIECGTYGSFQNHVKNGVRKNGKAKYFLSRLFLPYETMRVKYPILKKAPVLLPFCEIMRHVEAVFDKEKRLRAKKEMKLIKEQKKQAD